MIHVSMPPHFIHTNSADTKLTYNIFIGNYSMMAAKDCITVISYFSFTLIAIHAATIFCLPGLSYFCHSIFSSALPLSAFGHAALSTNGKTSMRK